MKKESKRKTSIKSSILILLLIAILLISSTYAWFTANTNVEISTLDVKVEGKNGLQISADGTTWKTILENTDIAPATLAGDSGKYKNNKNQIPTIMEPVSTIGELNTDGTMKMFFGTVKSAINGAQQLTASPLTDAQGTEGKYIAFDVFLKVDEKTQLSLTQDSTVTVKKDQASKGLENSSRVAFCVLGNTGAGSDITTIQGLNAASGTTQRKSHIWEPNYDTHTAAAIAHARDNYGLTVTDGGEKVEYYGVKAEITEDNAVALDSKDTYFEKVTPEYATKKENQDDTVMLELEAGITKVRIYMWVEGQDIDCENTASGSDIAFLVKFSIPAKK